MRTPIDQSEILTEIKNLSELEFAALVEQIKEHASANRWYHIISGVDQDELDELQDDIGELEKRNLSLTDELDDLKDKIEKAIDALS